MYYYYSKTLEGGQYKIHCRRKVPEAAGPATETELMDESLPEEILLSVPSQGRGVYLTKHRIKVMTFFSILQGREPAQN
jgi:hypothetical protein